MYFALIPGGSVASSSFVISAVSGDPIIGAIVKLVDYPQYNTTTIEGGAYTMNNVPIGTYNISAWAPGYVKNTSTVNVVASPATSLRDFTLSSNANMVGISWISSYNSTGTITSTMGSLLPRPSDKGTEFFGQYDSRKDTAGWFTAIQISDVTGTGANVNITYFYNNGTLYGTQNNQPIPANGTYTLTPGSSGLVEGVVKIKSNMPIVAEKRIASYKMGTWVTTGGMSVMMPERSSAGTEFYGQYYSKKDTEGWFSAILITDVTGIGANINITYFYPDGTYYSTQNNLPVPANGTYVLVPGSSGLLDGKVKIVSNNPIIAEKRIAYYYPYNTWNAYDLMADSLLKPSDAGKEMIVPIYDGNVDTTGWYSVVLISDIFGTGATINIDYQYLNGTLYKNVADTVPVNGARVIIPGDSGLKYGKMLIHSNNPVIGEERIANYIPGTWNSRAILSFNLPKVTDSIIDLEIPNYFSVGEWKAQDVVSAVNGASSPILYYYAGSGTLDHTEYVDIPINGSYAFYPGDVTKGRLDQGKVKIKGSI
jgi:hypothetical protein